MRRRYDRRIIIADVILKKRLRCSHKERQRLILCLSLYVWMYQIEVIFFMIGIIMPPIALPAATVSMYGISVGKVSAENI